jgi:hypothetical protein
MATAVLFIGWNRPHDPTNQTQAYEHVMSEGVSYLRRLEGQMFERMELIALTAHGGDVNGAIVLFGERAKLDELRRTDAFEAFVMKMEEIFDGLTVVPGVNLEGLQAVMGRMKKGNGESRRVVQGGASPRASR